MTIEHNGLCDQGLKRRINQDAVFMGTGEYSALFVVADGMGGHSHGEKASRAVVEEFRRWWKMFREDRVRDFQHIVQELKNETACINQKIFCQFQKDGVCGTTLAVLFIYYDQYCILSVGDSRVYHLRGWHMRQITVDDVWENQPEIILRGSRKNLSSHPNYGKLLHAVGTEDECTVNVRTDFLHNGDRFLLCSDGLYKMCDTKEIKSFMRSYKGRKNGSTVMEQILQTVYEKGARDNVSVIIALCRQ